MIVTSVAMRGSRTVALYEPFAATSTYSVCPGVTATVPVTRAPKPLLVSV